MRQSKGAVKRSANGGYVHVLHEDLYRRGQLKVRTIRVEGRTRGRTDLDRLSLQYQEAADAATLQALADLLGLSTGSVKRLRIGWDSRRRVWTFPMANSAGQVVGIRLRFPDGRKLSVTGGHEGLFVPDGIGFVQPLLLPEGPTDCAALLDLGFDAVGRPSCSGGVWHCVELVRTHWPLDVVVVSDGDVPGEHGAESLALALLPYAWSVRVIRPPDGMKDARAWKLAGASRRNVEAAIRSATARTCCVRSITHGH